MKAIGFIAVLGVVGFVGYWLATASAGEDNKQIGIVYAEPVDGKIEMQTIVGMLMVQHDRIDLETGKEKPWPVWIEEHFTMADTSGNEIELDRTQHTQLIPKHKLTGAHEFFLTARLDCGEEYTLTFQPALAEPKKYAYTFVAPSAQEDMQYVYFDLVK